MKWPVRRSFAVLIFIVLVCAVSFSTQLRRAVAPTPVRQQPSHDPACLSDRLLRLAAVDPLEDVLRRRVDNLLEGRLSAAAMEAMWHLAGPAVHNSLRTWYSFHHYDPSIMASLTPQLSIPRRIPSCAVVGNSGILLRANHGAHIDSHDAVFRLNNALISGYAAHVGSKTNYSFMHSNIFRLCAVRPGCFCHPYGRRVPILLYICRLTHFLNITTCNVTSSSHYDSPIYVTDGCLDILCMRIAKYYSLRRFVTETGRAPEESHRACNAALFRYSSGMQAIMVAVGVCDRVSVFGFGMSSDAKHHYHDKQKVESARHDYKAEYAFYHDLSEHPQVVPFLKDSGFTVPPVIFYH